MTMAQQRDLHVRRDVEKQETTARLAVLGQEGHAGVHGDARVIDLNLFAVDQDRARSRGRHAEERLGDVAAPRTYEAGDSENFSLAQIERHAVELAFETEVLHRQGDVADRRNLFR